MALRLITDHIADCAIARQNTAGAIKEVRNLLVSFIGAVFVTVVSFAGYSYMQSQALAKQLTEARISQAQAVSQIPDKTAAAVAAKLPTSTE